jgi:hypothetical protein
MLREALKGIAHAIAWIAVTPSVMSWSLRSRMMGPDRALEGSTQAWALVPGLGGQYLRRAFLTRTLRACDRTATIEFGTLFSSASASIGARAYIGPRILGGQRSTMTRCWPPACTCRAAHAHTASRISRRQFAISRS